MIIYSFMADKAKWIDLIMTGKVFIGTSQNTKKHVRVPIFCKFLLLKFIN